nr:c-type cytochrome [Spartinivicinus marinus]
MKVLVGGVPANAQSTNDETVVKLNELAAVGRQAANICLACHNVEKDQPHKIGPNLWGLSSRSIAGASGYQYSLALSNKQGSWNFQQLDKFLRQPAAFAPGNKMAFPGLENVSMRAAVIAWLATLNSKEANWKIPFDDLLSSQTIVETDIAATNKLLKAGNGSEVVSELCASCHSLRLVVQQGMNRERWEETLDWMVDEQGMDSIAYEKKQIVLDYLSTYYGE